MNLDCLNTRTFHYCKYFPCDLNEEESKILLKMNKLPENTYISSLECAYEFNNGKIGKFIKELNPYKLMDDIQKIKTSKN